MAEQVAAVGVEKQVEVRVMGDALEDAVRGEPLDGRAERIAGLTEKAPQLAAAEKDSALKVAPMQNLDCLDAFHRNPPVSLPTIIPMWSKYKPPTPKIPFHKTQHDSACRNPAGPAHRIATTQEERKAPSETEGALPTEPIVPHAGHVESRARGNRYPERYSPRRPLLRQLSPQGSCRL